jgi:hypothetical protein
MVGIPTMSRCAVASKRFVLVVEIVSFGVRPVQFCVKSHVTVAFGLKLTEKITKNTFF